MDIEWGKDGIDNKIYILQARPETVKSQNKKGQVQTNCPVVLKSPRVVILLEIFSLKMFVFWVFLQNTKLESANFSSSP